MEKIASPFLRRRGGEVGVPRNLFPRLGVGCFCTWERLKTALGGYRRRGFRLDSPAEEASTMVLAFFISCTCAHRWTDTCALHIVRTTTTTTPSLPPSPLPLLSLSLSPCKVFFFVAKWGKCVPLLTFSENQ